MSRTAVAMAFAEVAPEQNPNVRSRSEAGPSTPYMMCLVVAYSSLRRWNPDLELQLVTNAPLGGEWQAALDDLDVYTIRTPFDHQPPAGFTKRFSGSLFLLDALEILQHQSTLYLDPDVVCLGALKPMLATLSRTCGALPIHYPMFDNINGITLGDTWRFHEELGEAPGVPVHLGGECYYIPEDSASTVLARAEYAWRRSLAASELGRPHFVTEEHLMTYALRNLPLHSVEPWLKRIWTTPRHRTVDGSECGLVLWHLPAEKDRGFTHLYPSARDRESWFWTSPREEFVDRMGRSMGVWRRPPRRFLRDVAGAGVEFVSSALVSPRPRPRNVE